MSELPVEQKVAVFFDIQNLYHSSKNFGKSKISYKNLLEKIGDERKVVCANAYAAHRDGNTSKNFYRALEAHGIKVLSKRIQIHKDKLTSVHFDSEISVDALTVPEEVNTIVLCTGNGNFSYLVKALVEEGFRVEIWGFRESTSEKLLQESGLFVQISEDCLLASQSPEMA